MIRVKILLEGSMLDLNVEMTEADFTAELITNGGASRAGFAKIPLIPKRGYRSDTSYIYRSKVLAFMVVEEETKTAE